MVSIFFPPMKSPLKQMILEEFNTFPQAQSSKTLGSAYLKKTEQINLSGLLWLNMLQVFIAIYSCVKLANYSAH